MFVDGAAEKIGKGRASGPNDIIDAYPCGKLSFACAFADQGFQRGPDKTTCSRPKDHHSNLGCQWPQLGAGKQGRRHAAEADADGGGISEPLGESTALPGGQGPD